MTNQIATIAVLGAGTMGRGIAHVAAQAGYQTHLYDTSAEALKKAEGSIHKNLAKGVELKKVDPQVAERAQ
ncbi:MAG TPA: 3-hydroxyacyl-CoA dehydrogenase NAD-binding domain-containing protein, partial [Thermoanaerobaculia bacterium]